MRLNAACLSYRELNAKIRSLVTAGEKEIQVDDVCGHRYLAAALHSEGTTITLRGVPGNDLACFMGPGMRVEVLDDAQDGVGNTMGEGKVVINGNAGDITGYAMRGGKILVQGNIGYRAGIHMKEYQDRIPAIVVGGNAGAFLGEYMAGGIIVLLGLANGPVPQLGPYLGTGIHGGVIYIRGGVDPDLIGEGAAVHPLTEEDRSVLEPHLHDFCREFDLNPQEVTEAEYVKVVPLSSRPYGALYVY